MSPFPLGDHPAYCSGAFFLLSSVQRGNGIIRLKTTWNKKCIGVKFPAYRLKNAGKIESCNDEVDNAKVNDVSVTPVIPTLII